MTRFYLELLKHFSFHKQQSYKVKTNGYITVIAFLLKIDIDDSKTTDLTLNNTKPSQFPILQHALTVILEVIVP